MRGRREYNVFGNFVYRKSRLSERSPVSAGIKRLRPRTTHRAVASVKKAAVFALFGSRGGIACPIRAAIMRRCPRFGHTTAFTVKKAAIYTFTVHIGTILSENWMPWQESRKGLY